MLRLPSAWETGGEEVMGDINIWGMIKDFLDVSLACLLRDLNIRIKYSKYNIFFLLQVGST